MCVGIAHAITILQAKIIFTFLTLGELASMAFLGGIAKAALLTGAGYVLY